MTKISLAGMEFYGHHGCFEEERIVGAHFSVDVSFEYDAAQAVENDDVMQSVDYPEVYSSVKRVMDNPTRLIETLAARIVRQVKADFPEVSNVCVKVCKLNPPLDTKTRLVSAEMREA